MTPFLFALNLDMRLLCTGGQWRAALTIYNSMDAQGLPQDAITCSSVISALAKGKQWSLALQVSFACCSN